MAVPESNPPTSVQAKTFIAQCDRILAEFLDAVDEARANERLEYLTREFITPIVKTTLSFELRRGPRTTYAQLRIHDEAFRELEVIASGKLVSHLLRLRDTLRAGAPGSEPIQDLSGYAGAVARNALADYMRERFPGRHALDTSLRAVLGSSVDLALWRHRVSTDYVEWRCGRAVWQEDGRLPVSLWSNPALRATLWGNLSGAGVRRAEALRLLFDLVGAPILYTDLLDFLAALWKVEAHYRNAALERADIRVPFLAAHTVTPESAAVRIGALQEAWALLQRLSRIQRTVLLLRLPPADHGNFVTEFVRLGIVGEEELARSLGLSVDTLMLYIPVLPLEDVDIATLLKIPLVDVRRIRQDARRRLARLQVPRSKENEE